MNENGNENGNENALCCSFWFLGCDSIWLSLLYLLFVARSQKPKQVNTFSCLFLLFIVRFGFL